MTIEIACFDRHSAARDYVLGVIFDCFLNLQWRRTRSENRDFRIRLCGADGEIRMPDCLFSQAEETWLSEATLPSLPLLSWDTTDLATDIPLIDPVVPVLYGKAHMWSQTDHGLIDLPVDLFGSAFFMLSRYEEAVIPDRDLHNRFPSTASLAYRAGFLNRPIVDEYVEILWTAMQRLWPVLKRPPRTRRIRATCDVDIPFAFTGTLKGMGRRFAADLVKRRSAASAFTGLLGNWRVRRGDHSSADPYRDAIDTIMDINERAGQAAAFYFIPEKTNREFDTRYNLDAPRMRALLRHIHARGHEIGLHPGYNTYKHPVALARSVARLRHVLDEEKIEQPILGGRQHYLRWETPTTARLWDDNGMDYDSTLCYADRPGFRCGTSRAYPMFDLVELRQLALVQQPLILMECSVIADRYLGMGYSNSALDLMLTLKDRALRFGGEFTLLWHNSHFCRPQDYAFYKQLVA